MADPSVLDHEVAIVGGGPAGAAAARLLALWGRDVVLLTAARDRGRDLAVSLPPSSAKLLSKIGVLDAVDAAGFVRSSGNTVWWGGSSSSRPFADGTFGYQVRHGELDRVLLAAAEAAGVRVLRDTTVVQVDPEDTPAGLVAEHDGARLRVDAGFLLDASGRAGIVARDRGLRVEAGSRTIALAGRWRRRDGWALADDSHTLVESFRDGWAWSVPVGGGTRFFTCMLDPAASDTGAGDLADRYGAALGRAPAFARLLDGADREGEPWGCDASCYHATECAGDRFLLLGDAASFIDPLSSFGVKKALASGWLGAIVANTILAGDGLEDDARAIFERHERRFFDTSRQQAAGFFEAVAADLDHPFWTGRARRDELPPGEPDIDRLRTDEEVLAAFEQLKASPSIALARAPEVVAVRRAVIGERSVVEEEHLASPSVPDGLRFLRGVDVRILVELSGDHDRVPDLFDAYNRRAAPVPLPDFLGALSVLLAKDVLRNQAVC